MPKARNNPVPTADDFCEVCGQPYAHLHEIFGGSGNRQKSIKWGMQKRLCYKHHNEPGEENPHSNAQIDRAYKEEYQARFEKDRMLEGMTSDEAHKFFIHEFGRNYL